MAQKFQLPPTSTLYSQMYMVTGGACCTAVCHSLHSTLLCRTPSHRVLTLITATGTLPHSSAQSRCSFATYHNWYLLKLSHVNVACQVQTHSCNEAHESYEQPTSDAQSRLLSWYWLDEASLLPALVLDPKPGHTVLDMCAAPGGKSLMLALMLFDQQRSALTSASAVVSSGRPSAQSPTADRDRQGSGSVNHAQHSAVNASELSLSDSNACSTLPPLQEASTGTGNTQQAATAAAANTEQPTSDLADVRVRIESCAHAASNSDLNLPATLSAQHGQHTAAVGSLTCNELDPSRKSKLQTVMDSYLPLALKNRVRLELSHFHPGATVLINHTLLTTCNMSESEPKLLYVTMSLKAIMCSSTAKSTFTSYL